MPRSIDLNADLGEGSPHDAALLEVVTSASVACGFHAGDPQLMLETARQAARQGVAVGAHPSYGDREGFGRRPVELPRDELVALLVYQVGAMAAAAGAAGTQLRFVKPHGSLYNQAAVHADVADAVLESLSLVATSAESLALLCPAGSALATRAEAFGVRVIAEAFIDRAYSADGTLVPRSEPGSVLGDEEAAVRQALELAVRGTVSAFDGSVLEIHADSLCIHGDSPGALRLARAVRRSLEDAGVTIASFIDS